MITALITALKWIGGVLAGLILLKSLWVARFFISGSALIAGRARHDHFARLSYLVDKLLTTPFHVQDMPSYLRDPFKGEWALVAC